MLAIAVQSKERFLRVTRNEITLFSMYLWIAIFIVQPHKEERFMYVIYPLICYNAAHAILSSTNILNAIMLKRYSASTSRFVLESFHWIVFILYVALSLGRVLAQVRAFTAPMQIYANITTPSTVCLGKEWYRFPSSFFIPDGSRALFVKSAFHGLLPGRFAESQDLSWRDGTWQVPSGMNDQNLEETSHMVYYLCSAFSYSGPT
jgi:alpha-1,2-mannosyltransferase